MGVIGGEVERERTKNILRNNVGKLPKFGEIHTLTQPRSSMNYKLNTLKEVHTDNHYKQTVTRQFLP